jgi:diguanylate cyclase (GGDEF)-like protein/PAS domain S-box-containing protein
MRQGPSKRDHATPQPLGEGPLRGLIDELSANAPELGKRLGFHEPQASDIAPLTATSLTGALDLAGLGIAHLRRDGAIIAASTLLCQLAGHSEHEILGRTIGDFLDPDDAAAFALVYRDHAARGTAFTLEQRWIAPSGHASRTLLNLSFVAGHDGSEGSAVAVVQDVSARYDAEAELREREVHYRAGVELSPQISWTASPTGLVLDVSQRWEAVTGRSQQSALGEGWIRTLHGDDAAPTLNAWREALRIKGAFDVEYRLRVADGTDRWFRSRAVPRLGAAGEIIRWYGTLEDIDDRKCTEQALRESEERFRLAAQAAGLGIWDFDAVHDRREWSGTFKAMLGLDRDAEPLTETALALVAPQDRHLLHQLMEAVYAGKSEHRFEVLLRIHRANDGEERWMQTGGWRIEAPGGDLQRVLVTVMDVTEQRNAAERIRWAAQHDALTGLPNRAYFGEELEAAIATAQDQGSSLALILFDIDNLKETNDTIGHDAGDMLLQNFAEGLRISLGDRAFLARLGGDEFAAFFPVADEEEIAASVAAALQVGKNDFTCNGLTLTCDATAGAAQFPRDGTTAKDLLKTADIALYAGKAGQKGMLSIFKPPMRARVERRATMLAVARNVIGDDRIVPYYQPKVALADGRVAAFEALLRWRHDALGIQGPDQLCAAFEDMHLATALGERMLDRVCQDMTRWLDRGLDFGRIAINISPAQIRREDLFDRTMERLHRSGLSPALLELEVTESVFMGSGAGAVGDVLRRFHEAGMSIALDDFGTGYASLTHLQSFPIDVIKIDRSFVTNLAAGSANAAIVDAIIGLGGRLGMEVIAEGIESHAEADYLRERGCGYGQGYLFGRPAGRDEVERLLAPG